ncbi:hypothetical protein QO016_004807 [Methylobacterium persicinum]|uniref:Uncharacterized protein n=1 Tax=Methylobacterium persicinum TaxID=374426 RepID=A0ABU0HSH0_9HYPH|nr:hypothetical protein [Methylobacterium persicinum]GJE36156.1 hypothetical protein KHHGKMAE_0203 [Methylobacterium persicinum]
MKSRPESPATFSANQDNVRYAHEDADGGLLDSWVGEERRYRVQEEVFELGEYGRTLTVLACN